MNKKELDAKLNEIQSRLSILGDLNGLIQKGAELPSLVSQAQTTNAAVQQLLPKLSAQQQSLTALTSEISALKEELSGKNSEIDELVQKTNEIQEKTESLKQQTLTQLGLAANEKLSNSFEQVKVELAKEKDKWFNWLVGAVAVLVVGATALAGWQVYEFGTLYHFAFLIKIALTAPLVYFIVFINREYSRTSRLIEEYAFKAAIARSFEAYKEILQDAFVEQQSLIYQKKLDFILEAVAGLYSSPMRNVKENMTKEREISPDIFSQLKDHIVPNLPKP